LTQLMELLTSNNPWNLILFFAIPLGAGTISGASELFVLYRKETHGPLKTLNIASGWLAAGWFCWVSYTLLTTYWLPDQWRNAFDFVSMTTYIGLLVPLLGMAIVDLPWVKIRKRPERRLAVHAGFSMIFRVMLFVAVGTAFWTV